MPTRLTAALFFLALPLPFLAQPAQQPQQADLLLLHGHILTVDSHDTVAQAIAMRGNTILKTGTDAEIQALAGPNAKVIDLKGATAPPALSTPTPTSQTAASKRSRI